MFVDYTYQDYEATKEADRPAFLLSVVKSYKLSDFFKRALMASRYFCAKNDAISQKKLVSTKTRRDKNNNLETRKVEIVGNRIYSNFFFSLLVQQNQYLLGNGVTLDNAEQKALLGLGFDKKLEQAGEKALQHGVCWGYWNNDHLEIIPAASDPLSGFVMLQDERTGDYLLGVQFWQIGEKRPLYLRVFELDGVTEYVQAKGKKMLDLLAAKTPYVKITQTDAAGVVSQIGRNYNRIPIVPLWANDEHCSELTNSIRSKIDLYDRVLSDFGDNLDRANDVYWILNNFGGTMAEVQEMLSQINELKAVVNVSDGMGGGSTAQPAAFEVPYAARQTALKLLRDAIYGDFMALNKAEITGGSLTNVAIDVSMIDINLKCDRYEWQVFAFVQGILQLAGVTSEKIRFKRQSITNRGETVQDILNMRDDIDLETALKLNPYIDQEEIPEIIKRRNAEDAGFVTEDADYMEEADE